MFKREFEIYLQDSDSLRRFFEGNEPYVIFDTEGSVREKQFDINEPEGFSYPKNYPNCCPYHNSIPNYIAEWFDRFPNCCEDHKKYNNYKWFQKKDYTNISKKIILQTLYTEYFIESRIDTAGWYQDITNYIDYNIASFGSPEIGADRYVSIIHHLIKYSSDENLPLGENKRYRLIEYFERMQEAPSVAKTDINILYSIFQKWVKAIPNIGSFKVIKENSTDKFPINLFLYDGEYNPYLGETKFKQRTKGDLINILVDLTRKMLLEFSNNDQLIGYDYAHERHIQMIKESHRLQQCKLLLQFENEEKKYIKIIKQWLENEKLFFENIIATYNTMQKDKHTANYVEENDIHKHIYGLIAQDKINEALGKMNEFCSENLDKKNRIKEIIQLQGRLSQIEQRVRQNLVSNNDSTLERDRIRNSCIGLADLIFQDIHTK